MIPKFVFILLKIFKENGIQFQPPEYIVDLAQARIIRAAKNGQLNILKFLVEFSSNTMTQWNPTVPTETVVNHETLAQKCPLGQRNIAVTRPNQSTISVKLPKTGKYEFWCTIKVDGSEKSIKCPIGDRFTGEWYGCLPHLCLKVSVLKQAASLANSAATTVRIPMEFYDQSENFGVFAIPGLQSHVFVGPFSKQNLRPPIKIAADNGHLDIVKYLTDLAEAPTIHRKINFKTQT